MNTRDCVGFAGGFPRPILIGSSLRTLIGCLEKGAGLGLEVCQMMILDFDWIRNP